MQKSFLSLLRGSSSDYKGQFFSYSDDVVRVLTIDAMVFTVFQPDKTTYFDRLTTHDLHEMIVVSIEQFVYSLVDLNDVFLKHFDEKVFHVQMD